MKNRQSKRIRKINWLLCALIIPPFLAVVAPFFIIVRVALMPEGYSSSKNRTITIWTANGDFGDESYFAINKGYFTEQMDIYGGDGKISSIKWELENDDLSWAQCVVPFRQNLSIFDKIHIKLNSNSSSFIVGFYDGENNETHGIVNILETNRWTDVEIKIKNFDFAKVNRNDIKTIYFRFDQPKSGYMEISEVMCHYKLTTFANFREVFLTASFGRYFFNSIFISLVVMLSNIIFSTMAGFAFAWRPFPLRRTLFALTIAMIMIPMQVLMIPTFILIQNLGWINSYKALIVPFLISPINIFLMKQYISKIPKDYAESALVDGASYFRIFFNIILPMCKPALAIVAINTFVNSWNSFLYPFIFTNTAQMRTLPVGLALYIGLFDVDWVHLMAASTISALPAITVFVLFQKQIISGMLSGTFYRT